MRVTVSKVDFRKKSFRTMKKNALEKIASSGVKIIKQEINKRKLVNKGNLKRSVGADVRKSSVLFEIDSNYAGIINDGVKRHKMSYLVDAGPIPIKIGPRKYIFRVATKKNIRQRGKWLHPGFKKGKGFVDDSVNKITEVSKNIIASEGLI